MSDAGDNALIPEPREDRGAAEGAATGRAGRKAAKAAARKEKRARRNKRRRGGIVGFFGWAFGLACLMVLGGAIVGLFMVWHYEKDLPDYAQLAEYEPAVMTRVYAADGDLIGEFARERRLYTPIDAIPRQVIHAFLSAEDKNFYEHPGVDFVGIARAAVQNVENALEGQRMQGASTITQQVIKNFLLSSERKLERKIKEALLALRFERAFSKDRILELYLNEIYLGAGAYGVTAAALTYYDKPLNELTLEEIAFLAALPKAPSDYHPVRNRERSISRRNWVIERMLENGYVTADDARAAQGRPLEVTLGLGRDSLEATYFVEEIRRSLADRFGSETLYGGGLAVRSTFDARVQDVVGAALRKGLIDYDQAAGWRGPLTNVGTAADARAAIEAADLTVPADLKDWRLAVVRETGRTAARIAVLERDSVSEGAIALETTNWANPVDAEGNRGPAPKSMSDVLTVGDVVYVEAAAKDGAWLLRQVPEVNGAAVAMEPDTGRVIALQGGFSFGVSEFNRATQAARQPGSSFKPFVYAAALDNGYTPSSIIVDAPVVIDQGEELGAWKPSNYGNRFYGPSTLRLGVEKSRNLMTVRLAQAVGMDKVVDYARRFDIDRKMEPVLSMALGAGETTVMRMTAAYAALANGGKKVEPTLIDRIQDRYGDTVWRHAPFVCEGCDGSAPPKLADRRERILDARTAYQMVSILEGVVQRGTATSLKRLGRPVAGKTGTTNEAKDAWFVGFTPELAIGVYVGFDEPRSLGKNASGGAIAAPIFGDAMAGAMEGVPPSDFAVPPGVDLITVDARTGQVAKRGGKGTIVEAFKEGEKPGDGISLENYMTERVGGSDVLLTTGSGGLY